MQYRTPGKTGWRVSAVSMGCWNIGGQWGEVREETARATLYQALDCGVNHFDTADAYGTIPGASEEILGRAFHGMRDQVLLASKAGNYGRRGGAPLPFTSWLHVKLCCEASLFRLKTDALDLVQCHLGGASEVDLLPYGRENGIGTLIRGPLAPGVLAGKFSRDHRFTDSVRESWNDGPGRERFLQRLEAVERLRPLATETRPLAHVALRYLLAHPAVSCVIPGARSPEQVAANAAAADGLLTRDELEPARAATGGA